MPLAMRAMAARLSPCEPVQIITRFSRGMRLASLSGTKSGISRRYPTSFAAEIVRFSARPAIQTERLFALAAVIMLSIRATLLAKQVTATIFSASAITFVKPAQATASDGVCPGTMALVESPISAITPSSPKARNRALSASSPSIGVASNFQSPVCKTTPSGVRKISAAGSGMEWVIETNSTEKGPKL